MKRIGQLIVVIGMGIATVAQGAPRRTQESSTLTAEDQLRWDAAQALYGGGLVVTKTKGGVAIAAAADGLTQDKFDRYVGLYLETLKTMSGRRKGTSFKWLEDYSDAKFDPRAATKLGMLLLEPAFKFTLCRELAGRIGDKPTSEANWDRTAWCVQQGITDATTNVCIYRGEKVECSAAADVGALKVDEPIFVKNPGGHYPIVVAVSGGRDFITNRTVSIAGLMLDSLVSSSKLTPKIKAEWKQRLTKYHALERAADKRQRKLAKNQLAFADRPFSAWDVQPSAKKVSCKTSYVVLYAPAQQRANDYYEVVAVDGKVCDEHPLGAGETARRNLYLAEQCRTLMEKGPEHTIEVSLHLMKIGATSTQKELKDGKVKDVTYEWGKAGKRLFGATVTCTM